MKKKGKIVTAVAGIFLFLTSATLFGGGKKGPTAITGVAIPEGYRSWKVVSASHRTDKGEIRLILANDVAYEAFQKKTLPFPDGSILAKLAYKAEKHPAWEAALVPGKPMRQEFMVKDSKRFSKTGGWGFGRFVDGKPVGDEKLYASCFPCHESGAADQDYVFTRFSP
ncbi:MAG: cytochrome C oxidase subunit III [Deltaproteobacteria bacterium]|nr:MAG: cytochrome C oxidase subunit III [Deltaproteobacteria bacterium]